VVLRLDFRQHVARIEVVDTGIGIAPQDQQRIFLPFERGSAGRRVSEAGTGLGLTITHLLTDMMGGELTLHSRPGWGSTFTVRLYLPGIAPDPAKTLGHGALLRPVTGYAGARRTLLVVDDQPLHRQLLAGLLMPLGFVVREAASGQECLEIVQQQAPDLVLLDLTMDGLDGWQTAAALRQMLDARQLPIVFVSANLLDHQPERLQALQCQAFVGKPVIESELLNALEQGLAIGWLRDTVPAVLPVSAAQNAESMALMPAALREDLVRLARQGQAPALRDRLRQARAQWPQGATQLDGLQALAERFDFQALADRLRLPHDAQEEDTDDPRDD
jgi:CheY-like chemotaxis protein